jgi:hypothetical protein
MHRVSVLDFGVKQNILRCLAERGCYLKLFPLSSTKEEILAFNPDGIMYSNGPGDPSAMPNTIQLIRELNRDWNSRIRYLFRTSIDWTITRTYKLKRCSMDIGESIIR